jgi:hypothetical protein
MQCSMGFVVACRVTELACLWQGIVGGMPWNAVGYFTMWLQTLGFSDVPAATLTALFWGGTALGNLLGGIVGDLLARRLPNSGRQLTCQVSVLREQCPS